MKVAINTLPLKSGHSQRGIGTYTKNLLEELNKIEGVVVQEFAGFDEVNEADVVHYPFFDLFYPTLPLHKKYPTVVTIHDVTPLVFPEHYPLGIRGKVSYLRQSLSLKSVSAVITDSNSSKRGIIKYLGYPADKIFVVYLSAAKHFKIIRERAVLEKIKQRYNLPDKFAIYTGNVNWNKNLLGLAKGVLEAGIDLVLVGKSFEERSNLDHPELKSFKEFLKRYSESSRVSILGFVPDDDLVALYNLAAMTLLPSFYEGFGLPILESQSCGTPVITSNTSSMPEVAGEGAVLVNPNQVQEIDRAVRRILTDQKFREALIKEGFKNCQKFSWDKVASQTIDVYEKIKNSN